MHGKCQGPATSREETAYGPARCVKAMIMTRGSLTGLKSAAAFAQAVANATCLGDTPPPSGGHNGQSCGWNRCRR
eukprot:90012-Chlamydomonas_euryale.AAC.1